MRRFNSLAYRLRLLCLLALLPALLPSAASGTPLPAVAKAAPSAQQINGSSPLAEIAQATPPARLVRDILPGQVEKNYTVRFETMIPVGGWLYFVTNNAANGAEIWRTDGNLAHTALVSDLCPGPCSYYPYSLDAIGNTLFFLTNHPTIRLRI